MEPFEPTILVIDDNVDFAENLAEMVEDFGFRPVVVESGRQAREKILDGHVDFALIDLNLPDVGGLELLSLLKKRNPDCICIIITGNASIENAIESLNRGAFSYLVKGAEAEEYRSAIQNALNFIKSRKEVLFLRGINQNIIDNFPGRILVLDGEGHLLQTNDFPVELERFFLEHLPRLRGEDRSTALQPWARSVVREFRQLVRGGKRSVLSELEVPGENGAVGTYTIHFIPLSHRVARFLIFIEDVTETRKLKEEIKRSEKLATVGELAMTIAHEVRNPLAGISGAVQILRDKMPLHEPDRRICDEVIALVDRLNRTMEDLLLLARPFSMQLVSTALRDVVDSYLSLLRDDQRFKHVKIETEIPGDGDRCRADPFRLQQAIANVVINAAEAMDGKGCIRIVVERRGPSLTLRVLDEGPGLPADAGILLEPFWTTKAAGTGLGLSITRKIVEAHSGHLVLRNRTDRRGAEVCIELPGEGQEIMSRRLSPRSGRR